MDMKPESWKHKPENEGNEEGTHSILFIGYK